MKRDSHAMTEANWTALEQAAKAVGCASWRVMLRRIAAGELVVAQPSDKALTTLGKMLGVSLPTLTSQEHGVLRDCPASAMVTGKPLWAPIPSMARDRRRNAAPIARPSEAKAKK